VANEEPPADTGGPPVTLDDASHRALFPDVGTRRAFARQELRSAMGGEGARALAVYVACALVLAYGVFVVWRTWNHPERTSGVSVLGHTFAVAVLWYVFAAAVGLCGWFLSGLVTKRWLRAFVGVSLVLACVLLMTIGRSAHIRAAKDEAEAEARSLLAAAVLAGVKPTTSGESALLAMLCEQGGLDGSDENDVCASEVSRGGQLRIRPFDAANPEHWYDSVRYRRELDCLPGWTVGTFVEWTAEASSDRQVAALSALASCEIGVVNPAAEEVAAEEVESTATTTTTAVSGGGATPAADGDASGGVGTEPSEQATSAVRAALQVQRSELTAQQAVSAGADELLTYASGQTEFPQLRFSVTAWLVLAAAALLWYRRLEIRAGRHRLGPVDVQFELPAGAAGSEQGEAEARPPRTRAEAVFKESVIRNVPEPGAIPGGEALAPVGDLVAQTDVPHRSLISAVIDAASTILATSGGFTVIFSVRPSDDGQEHVAFVRLRDTRTGNHLASNIFYDRVEEHAARRAGYWIAGWIISRSAYVPSWAQWSEEDASSFPPLPPAWSAGVQPAAQRRVPPEMFDPNAVNSLILAQRAYSYQTTPPAGADRAGRGRRNHVNALEDIARAVHRSPRYPVGRYRRGAALATMMFRGGDLASAVGLSPGAQADQRLLRAVLATTAFRGGIPSSTASLPLRVQADTCRQRLPSAARLRHLLSDLLVSDQLRATTGDGHRADVEGWVVEILDRQQPFPDDMRIAMLRLVAEWSNRNRAALRWSWVAWLRPSERFFWNEFRRTGLGRDWKLVSASELCLCAERLKFRLARTGRLPGDEDAATGSATEKVAAHGGDWWRVGEWWRSGDRSTRVPGRWLDELRRIDERLGLDERRRRDDLRKLADVERKVCDRALKADSHWQISYNLACLHAVRADLWRSVEKRGGLEGRATRADAAQRAAACRAVALDWLERCLDRPASSQLVREWVDADGDLDPLRGTSQFAIWRERVRSNGEAPGGTGNGGRVDGDREELSPPDRGAPPPAATAGTQRR
jgi:hypothetical protein